MWVTAATEIWDEKKFSCDQIQVRISKGKEQSECLYSQRGKMPKCLRMKEGQTKNRKKNEDTTGARQLADEK